MALTAYAGLARNRTVRNIEALGFLVRVPVWAANVVITLHIVTHLHRSYAEAGIVAMLLSVAMTVGGPWRGRLLDKVGLRRTIAPSLVVAAICWSLAPWVGYWPLVVLGTLASLYAVPSFSVVRQVLIGAVSEGERTAALALDSVMTEVSFMVGPVLGVLAATTLPTSVALMGCQLLSVAGGVLLWASNPPLHRDGAAPTGPKPPRRVWVTPGVIAVLLVTATTTLILTTEDLGSVAALRSMHHTDSLGWVLALWGAGSAVGGVVYGAMRRHPPAAVLLVPLAVSTALVSLAHGRLSYTLLLFLSGVFCAPAITATVDDLSRIVPVSVRGEAMGWHGAALTLGGAIGAPVVGKAIDAGGWSNGLLVGGVTGLVIALVGLIARARRLAHEEDAAAA